MGSSHELGRLKLNAKRSSRGDGKSPRYSERSPRGSDVRSISAETERKKKVIVIYPNRRSILVL